MAIAFGDAAHFKRLRQTGLAGRWGWRGRLFQAGTQLVAAAVIQRVRLSALQVKLALQPMEGRAEHRHDQHVVHRHRQQGFHDQEVLAVLAGLFINQ